MTTNNNTQRPKSRKIFLWMGGVGSLLYILLRLASASPPPNNYESTLDDSWMQTLNWAFVNHMQFGRDIVFTYGPWGFLCRGCHPATFLLYSLIWTVFSVVFWLAGWRLARHFSSNGLVAGLWLTGLAALISLPGWQNFDVRLIAWVVVLLSLHFFVEDQLAAVTKLLLAVSLGCLGLVKFTGLVMATAVILLISADELFRRRRVPWIFLAFVISLCAFWLAAGQAAGLFWRYLENSWQITSGYTEAMMTDTDGGMRDLVIFWLMAAVAVAPMFYLAFKKNNFWGLLPAAGLGVVIFLVFKHGFVRHDQHIGVAVLAVLLMGLASLAVVWPVIGAQCPRGRVVETLRMLVLCIYAVVTFHICVSGENLPADVAVTFSPLSLLTQAKSYCAIGQVRLAYEIYLQTIHAQLMTPAIDGTVDVYSWDQAAAFASGLEYHPRPVFQSYTGYTPKLEEMNANFLRSDDAPANLLLHLQTIDRRYPSLDDGLSWPEFLTRYDLKKTNGNFLLLERAMPPREYHLMPIGRTDLAFNENYALDLSNGPVWARLEIDQSRLGRLASVIYKPPVIFASVQLRDGSRRLCRIVPGMAREGFLISPLVEDNETFALLTSAGWPAKLAAKDVVSLSLTAYTDSHSTACYQPLMHLYLYHLDYPRQHVD